MVLSTGEDFELEYSLDGNQAKRTYDNGKTVTYSYDGIGQLISEQNGNDTTSYSYDSRGNRVKMTKGGVVTDYDYTRSNQLKYESVSENGSLSEKTTYNYDNNGNMIFKGHEKYVVKNGPESVGIYVAYGTGDEELSVFYTYDSRNRLIGVDSETTQAAYTYDALGRRSSKTVNGDTTKHIWSGSEIVEDTDADGGVKAKYYRGINPVATVTKTAGEATVYYYRYDEKGSVTSMSGSGGIALSYEYDAFGNQTEAEGDVYNPYRYTGEYYDEETGFVYLRNRYYDPSIGRFTQEDPAKDGTNWYVYCGNNPIAFVDPNGLTKKEEQLYEIEGTGIEVTGAALGYYELLVQNIDAVLADIEFPEGELGERIRSIEESHLKYFYARQAQQMFKEGRITGNYYPDVPDFKQGDMNLCWAYAYVNIDAYWHNKNNPNDEQILRQEQADDLVQKLLKGDFRTKVSGKGLLIDSTSGMIEGLYTVGKMIDAIFTNIENGPFVVRYADSNNNGHMVTVTGAIKVDGEMYFRINNPWETYESKWLTYDEFLTLDDGSVTYNLRNVYMN